MNGSRVKESTGTGMEALPTHGESERADEEVRADDDAVRDGLVVRDHPVACRKRT